MQYSAGAREAIDAIRGACDGDGAILWSAAFRALADLYPFGAIGFALRQPTVWSQARRRQGDGLRAVGGDYVGFDELVAAIEASCSATGTRVVDETHVVEALSAHQSVLAELGIAADALLATVEERTGKRRPDTPRRPRVVGAARAALLESELQGKDLTYVLESDESGGIVERKRTLLNKESAALADQEQAAVALVNGSPEQPVFMVFGQDDDLTVRGEVDHKGQSLAEPATRACRRRFVDRLSSCTPPVTVKWERVTAESKVVWIACMLGRARGTAVMTSNGVYPYRSGEDTFLASPQMIVSWLREPLDRDAPSEAPDEHDASSPPGGSGREASIVPVMTEFALEYQRALAVLQDEVVEFYKEPPNVPNAITGHSVANWQPVFGPILERFRPALEKVVTYGRRADEEELNRLARGLRTVFRLKEPRGGLSWIVDAPRLVTRVVADQLLLDAYCTHRWRRLVLVGQPPFRGYGGRLPWILTPEFRHLETLGHDAQLAAEVSLQEAQEGAAHLADQGVGSAQLRAAYSALSVGLGLAAMARTDAIPRVDSRPPWVAFGAGFWDEVEEWEAEPGILAALAELGGEKEAAFRAALPERLQAMLSAIQSSGRHVYIPSEGWEIVEALSKADPGSQR